MCSRTATSPRAWCRSSAGLLICGALALALALASATATLAHAGAAEPEPEELLVPIQEHYRKIETLRAGFRQTSRVVSIGRDELSDGSVVVKRPGRMRWEYVSPHASVIVFDGKTVRMYDAGEGKLQIAPVGPDMISPTALGFLLGESDLSSEFRAERLDAAAGELRLRLLPREDAPFEYLELHLAAETYTLRGSVLVDLFGNRTELLFHDVGENVPLTPDTFALEVPSDTEVIDLR